jgi:DNA processing protein
MSARDELAARLTLRLLPGLRDRAINGLIQEHGTARNVLLKPERLLTAGARSLPDREVANAVEAALLVIDQHGITVLTPDDAGYPSRLRDHLGAATPPLLFALGNVALLETIAVAIVGSRAMSEYGRTVTDDFARDLACSGYTILSGLALGVDAVAHRAALDAGGATIAVVGNGVDVCYPVANRTLRADIIERGLVLSQFAPGLRPAPYHFPERNLILAALSSGVLVAEAGARSGATITAHHAADLGLDVMVVPGPINSPSSVGSNRLLREGAICVTCVDDVLENLPPLGDADRRAAGARNADVRGVPAIADESVDGRAAAAIRAVLTREPSHLDDIVLSSRLPAHVVIATLQQLELAGVARQHPGSRFELRLPPRSRAGS